MAAQTPQNFSRRAGSGMPGRVRRSIDGNLESRQRFGTSIEVAKDGKIETRVAPDGGLMVTDDGLMIDVEQVGEKNRSPIDRIQEPVSNTTLATAVATLRLSFIELLDELRRTGNMRG